MLGLAEGRHSLKAELYGQQTPDALCDCQIYGVGPLSEHFMAQFRRSLSVGPALFGQSAGADYDDGDFLAQTNFF